MSLVKEPQEVCEKERA